MQPCNMQRASTVLVEEWKDCEELMPKPKEKWTFVNKEARKHRTEWCAAANKFQCTRCGRSGVSVKVQGKCEGQKWLREDSKHKLGSTFGRARQGKASGP